MEQWYGVEYRDMHTAVHGLFVYDNLEAAQAADDFLSENTAVYSNMAGDDWVMEHAMRTGDMVDADYSEINFRDVEWDDEVRSHVYCDPYDNRKIIVVNTGHVVHDLW